MIKSATISYHIRSTNTNIPEDLTEEQMRETHAIVNTEIEDILNTMFGKDIPGITVEITSDFEVES